MHRTPVDLHDAAGIRLVISGQDLDERRLPRAVLAQERMDLAVLDRKLQPGEG
jgi:hypothetical protein